MTDWADKITLAVLKYFDSDDQEFSDNLKSYITQALGEEREACAKVAADYGATILAGHIRNRE